MTSTDVHNLPGWFPVDAGSCDLGDTFPGEQFRGLNYLVRETTQNAIDAHTSGEPPVHMDFELIRFNREDIPCHADYNKKWNERYTDKKETERGRWYPGINQAMKKDAFWTLRIGDHNTSGLDYDGTDSCSWHSLVLAQNRSTKTGSQGGSFGLGSGANLVNSARRQVFYGSLGRKSNAYRFQGVGYATSKKKESSDPMHKGYWSPHFHFGEGYEGNIPMRDVASSRFKRRQANDFGTDIFIIDIHDVGQDGFIESSQIHQLTRDGINIVWSFIYNFAPAIKNGLVTASFSQDGLRFVSIANASDASDFVKTYIREYSETLNENTSHAEFLIKYFDDRLELHPLCDHSGRELANLFIDLEADEKITYAARSVGMRIDQPWQKDFRIGAGKPLAFLLHVTDDETNKLLRLLEGPDHLTWKADNISDYEKLSDAKEIQAFLRTQTRALLKKVLQSTSEDSVIVRNVSLLGDTGAGNSITDLPLRPLGFTNIRPKTVTKKENDSPGKGKESTSSPKKERHSGDRRPKDEEDITHEWPGGNDDGHLPAERAVNILTNILAIDASQGIYLLRFNAPNAYSSLRMKLFFIPSETIEESDCRLNPSKIISSVGAQASINGRDINISNFSNRRISIKISLQEKLMSTIRVSFDGIK